jgi:hypothetical protein
MAASDNHSDHPQHQPSPWRRPAVLAGISLAVIVGFFFLREHWGHVLGLAPYLLLLACPLMHLLHGHGDHVHAHHGQEKSDAAGKTGTRHPS